jgi:Aspartyl protease
MPIVECGFPSGLSIPAQPATASSPATPAITLNGPDALAHRGPTILIDIGFDPALFGRSLPSIPGASTPPAAITAVQVPALLDTGASESSIDEQLAQQLQLPLIDKQTSVGISGPVVLNVYLAPS